MKTSQLGMSAKTRHTRKMHKDSYDELRMQLAMNVTSSAQAKKVDIACQLMRWGITKVETCALAGLTVNVVENLRAALAEAGEGLQSPHKVSMYALGEAIDRSRPVAHVAYSAFIRALKGGMDIAGVEKLDGPDAGEAVVGAIRYVLMNPLFQSEQLMPRRLLTIAVAWVDGELFLSTCPVCKSETLRATNWVQKDHKGTLNKGSCPCCALAKPEGRRRAVELDLSVSAANPSTPPVEKAPKTLDLADEPIKAAG